MKITRQMIEDAAIEAGGEFTDDYSGRAMYGQECCGIMADAFAEDEIIDAIAEALADEAGDYEAFEGDTDDADEYRSDVRDRMSIDSLGRRGIYYFRGVK